MGTHDNDFVIEENTLVAYRGDDEHVVIPEDVRVIGEGAFRGNERMRTVDLGSVRHICDEAFMDCSSLESLVIPDCMWYIDECAYKGCTSLKSVEFEHSDTFAEDEMGSLDIGVEAFAECTALEKLDLHDIGFELALFNRAFAGCTALKHVDLADALCDFYDDVFDGCTALEYMSVAASLSSMGDLSDPGPDDEEYWDALRKLANSCQNLRTIQRRLSWRILEEEEEEEESGVDLDYWFLYPQSDGNTKRLTYREVAERRRAMPAEGLFQYLSEYDEIDIRGLDTWLEESLACMFKGCSKLNKLNLTYLDTSDAKDLRQMFFGCRSLISANLKYFDVSQVESMAHIFHNCHDLLKVNLCCQTHFSNLRSIWSAFDGCKSLVEIFPFCLESFDGSNRTDLPVLEKVGYAFRGCRSLKYMNLTTFDLSRVKSLSHLFCGCGRLRKADLTGRDLHNVTNMTSAFEDCASITGLDLSGLKGACVRKMDDCFRGCSSLTELDLSGVTVDLRYEYHTWRWFEGCSSLRTLKLPEAHIDRGRTSFDYLFDGCNSLERWDAPASWPVYRLGAVPEPTADCGMWWSTHDQAWLTVGEIRRRGPVADTYTSEPVALS